MDDIQPAKITLDEFVNKTERSVFYQAMAGLIGCGLPPMEALTLMSCAKGIDEASIGGICRRALKELEHNKNSYPEIGKALLKAFGGEEEFMSIVETTLLHTLDNIPLEKQVFIFRGLADSMLTSMRHK
jgi:hypothetical protein